MMILVFGKRATERDVFLKCGLGTQIVNGSI